MRLPHHLQLRAHLFNGFLLDWKYVTEFYNLDHQMLVSIINDLQLYHRSYLK